MKSKFILFLIIYLCSFENYQSQEVQLVNNNFTDYSLFCREVNSDSICYSFSSYSHCTSIPNDRLRCRDGHVVALEPNCVIYDQHKDKVFIGSCPYFETELKDLNNAVYRRIPQKIKELKCKESMRRSKILCGQCKENYYPLAYSYNLTCVHCPHRYLNILTFLLVAFIPLTIFGLVIIGLKVSISNSHLHGFVFYSQAVSAPPLARVIVNGPYVQQSHYSTVIKLLGSFYSLWNLDIFRSLIPGICLPTKPRHILWLEVAIGVYPLLMIIMLYVIIHYKNCATIVSYYHHISQRFLISPSNSSSLIDAFGTFIILASIKILTSSLDLMALSPVYELSQKNSTRWNYRLYYDPTLRYFKDSYQNNFYFSICIVLIFIVFPFVILVLYPCKFFHRCLNRTRLNWNTLHIFMDTFQGCYKNGTEPNSHDYRWFSALFFGGRMILCLIFALTYNSMYFIFSTMTIIILIILVIILEPFRTSVKRYSYSTIMFLLLLSLFYATIAGLDIANTKNATHVTEALYALSVMSTLIPLLPLLLIIAGKTINCFKSKCHYKLPFHIKLCLKCFHPYF